jgi:multidrug efflux system membrane fusion protein
VIVDPARLIRRPFWGIVAGHGVKEKDGSMRRLKAGMITVALAGAAFTAYVSNAGVRDWVAGVTGTTKPKAKAKSIPPAPVRTAAVSRQDVPIILEGVGNVQARSTIAIKARIDGQLMEAAVAEGQPIAKGDLLFKLDARPYEAQLRQAEANVARDKANLEKAIADAARAESLSQKGISPKTRLEEAETSVSALRAAVRASEATVEIARLNLEYATIRAPIKGRVGAILIAPGNMVKANDTQPILMLTEISPINVSFALPEQHVGELRSRLASRDPLVVEATVQGDDGTTEKGELFFINNAIDMSTGTIQVMARFANVQERLIPGQFVRARVRMTTLPNAVVAPSKAIQINQRGHYAWIVKPDNAAELRQVTIGPEVSGMTVVSRGLEDGERVVTDGQLRLFPGSKVNVIDDARIGAKAKEPS